MTTLLEMLWIERKREGRGSAGEHQDGGVCARRRLVVRAWGRTTMGYWGRRRAVSACAGGARLLYFGPAHLPIGANFVGRAKATPIPAEQACYWNLYQQSDTASH